MAFIQILQPPGHHGQMPCRAEHHLRERRRTALGGDRRFSKQVAENSLPLSQSSPVDLRIGPRHYGAEIDAPVFSDAFSHRAPKHTVKSASDTGTWVLS